MVKVAPSVLAADLSRLGEEVSRVEQAGADMIHVDIADGHFAPNITFGSPIIKAIRKNTYLPLDLHLMIYKPEKHVERFLDLGGDIISVHFEACNTVSLKKIIQKVRDYGGKIGVALKPETELSAGITKLLDQLDMIVLMSVPPGFSGQKFDPSAIPKISKLKAALRKKGLQVDLEVDGGINMRNAPLVIKAGATVIVAGASIFRAPNIRNAIRKLKAEI